MLRTIPASTTINLLDFLAPSLICRSRTFFTVAPASNSASASRTRTDALLQQRKIRDEIMGQVHNQRIIPTSMKQSHNKYLLDIMKAAGARDLSGALHLLGQMNAARQTASHDSLYRLPVHNQRQLSAVFVSQVTGSQENWTDDMKAIARDFALEAAANEIFEPLYTLMLAHIQRNEPDTVVELYTSYHERLKKPAHLESQQTEAGLALAEADVDQPYNPGHATIFLGAIAAHAMRNSFHDALRIYLIANIVPTDYRVQKLFESLNEDLIPKVQKYLSRLSVAALVSQPIELSKRIMKFSEPKSMAALERLYRNIIEGISGPEPYLAADESLVSPERPVFMTENGWRSFQTGFLRSERPDLASKIWKDLEECGFSPGVTMWTALIDSYAKLRDSRKAMLTWNTMLENGIKPDTLCYRAIITALFDDKKEEAALARFKEYHKNSKIKNEHAILVYNTVLRGLLRLSRINDATTVLRAMQSKGPAPDIVSFNTFLAYYCRQKDFKGLSGVVTQMSAANIPGDVVTFSTILTALLNAGRKDASTTILSLMRKQGIQPNVATYTAIIDHQIREQTEESLAAVLNILDKMEQDESTRPNEVTYTSVLAGLYRGSWISPEQADRVKKEIIAKMKRAGISLKIPTYHILIRAALSSSNPNGYLDALALIDEMEREGLPRTNTVWYILFAGLMQRDLWNVARVMVEKMEDSGLQPNV